MKAYFIAIMVFIFVLSGCSTQEKAVMEVIEDPAILEELNQKYIYPASYFRPAGWKSPDTIPPDGFIVFALVKSGIKPKSYNGDQLPNYPREDIEQCIQKYFDIPTEYLREADFYDDENRVYHTWGIGNTVSSRVRGATKIGEKLHINYEYYSELYSGIENYTFGYGILTMESLEDGDYKFVANKFYDLDEPKFITIGESTPNK